MKPFAYVTAEKAALYRVIMRVFVEAHERFVPCVRLQEVLDEVRRAASSPAPDQAELEAALAQLCEWGNLQKLPDTSDVETVEDFGKRRYVFQITRQGEAAERALDLFAQASRQEGRLQTNALADVRGTVRELEQLSRDARPDPRRIQRNLRTLWAAFDSVTQNAQSFMITLDQQADLQLAHTAEFLSETQRLIDYVERFVGELMLAADDIAQTLRALEGGGAETLLRVAAECSQIDAAPGSTEDPGQVAEELRIQWERLRAWFLSQPGCWSKAELLRRRARTSMTGMLSLIASINDQRIYRIDRTNDLRILARWFAEARTDADAHRLWRIVFGLSPARHLITNDATLDQHEARDLPPDTSWLDAPPLSISVPLRAYGSYSRTGRLGRLIDRSAEKAKLAAAAREEARRILSAQNRFEAGSRMRLSDLEWLDTGELDVLLDLLGEAVSANAAPDQSTEIVSNDGSIRVTLEPTRDGRTAVIKTPEGSLSGPDHWISIEKISVGEFAL